MKKFFRFCVDVKLPKVKKNIVGRWHGIRSGVNNSNALANSSFHRFAQTLNEIHCLIASLTFWCLATLIFRGSLFIGCESDYDNYQIINRPLDDFFLYKIIGTQLTPLISSIWHAMQLMQRQNAVPSTIIDRQLDRSCWITFF